MVDVTISCHKILNATAKQSLQRSPAIRAPERMSNHKLALNSYNKETFSQF